MKIKQTKEEIAKQVKELVMSDEIVKTQLKNLKVQRRQWTSSKKWRKSLEVTNAASCGWPTSKETYLKHLKPTTNLYT